MAKSSIIGVSQGSKYVSTTNMCNRFVMKILGDLSESILSKINVDILL